MTDRKMTNIKSALDNGIMTQLRNETKNMRKIDLLELIEVLQGDGYPRHRTINWLRVALEK